MSCLHVAMPDALFIIGGPQRPLWSVGCFQCHWPLICYETVQGTFPCCDHFSLRKSVEVHYRHLHLYIKLNCQHRGPANESYFIGCTLAHWLWMLNEYQMSVKGQRKRLQLVNTQLLWMSHWLHNKNNFYGGIINILCSLHLINETQTEQISEDLHRNIFLFSWVIRKTS